MYEDKNTKFRRLAKLRGERVLKDLRLIGNLSNRNNYDYNQSEVQVLFSAIDAELKATKHGFVRNRKPKIKL